MCPQGLLPIGQPPDYTKFPTLRNKKQIPSPLMPLLITGKGIGEISMHRVFIMVYLFLHVKNRYETVMDGFSVSLTPRWTPKEVFLGCAPKESPR